MLTAGAPAAGSVGGGARAWLALPLVRREGGALGLAGERTAGRPGCATSRSRPTRTSRSPPAFGLVAAARAAALVRRSPRARALGRRRCWSLRARCSCSTPWLSVQIFAFLRSPLTYALLYLAGDMGSMRSSIGSFVTPALVAACVLVPAAYVPLVRRTPRRRRGARPPRWAPGCSLAAVGWTAWGAAAAGGRWSDRSDVLIAQSPHSRSWPRPRRWSRGERRAGDRGQLPARRPRRLPPGPPERQHGAARGRGRATCSWSCWSRRARATSSLYGSRYPTTPHLSAEAAHAVVYDRVLRARRLHRERSRRAHASRVHPYMTWREYTQEYPDFPGAHRRRRAEGRRGTAPPSSPRRFVEYVNQDALPAGRGYDEVRGFEGARRGRARQLLGRQRRGARRPHAASGSTATARARSTRPSGPSRRHHPYDRVPGPAHRRLLRRRAAAARRLRPRPLPERGGATSTTQLGRLFAGLRARGLDDETLVVVTGDHGEAFGDPARDLGPRLPAVRRGRPRPARALEPGAVPAGAARRHGGGHVDVAPTVLDLLGVAAPAEWEGRSLFAVRPPAARVLLRGERPLPARRARGRPQVRLRRQPRPRPALRPRARPGRAAEPARPSVPRSAGACGSAWPRGSTTPRPRLAEARALWRGTAAPGRRRRSDRRHAVAPPRAAAGTGRDARSRSALRPAGARSRGDAWIGDFWIYAATVGELAAHPFHPANPLFAEPYAFAFLSPCAVVLGLFARVTGCAGGRRAGRAGARQPRAARRRAVRVRRHLDEAPCGGVLRAAVRALPVGPRSLAASAASSTCAAWRTCFRIRRRSRPRQRSARSRRSPGSPTAPKAWVPLVVRVGALLFAVHPVTAMFLWVGLVACSLGAPRSRAHWRALGAARRRRASASPWPGRSCPCARSGSARSRACTRATTRCTTDPLARIAPALLGVPWLLCCGCAATVATRWRCARRASACSSSTAASRASGATAASSPRPC